jgi:toxin ParE1/3/4
MAVLRCKITPFARGQIRDVVQYYAKNASPLVASRFREDLKASIQLLSSNPMIGSLRFAHLMQEMALRTWSLHRFPFRIFYTLGEGVLCVIAVEHESRTITPAMFKQTGHFDE